MVVAFRRSQNALVVVSELDEIYSVALAVVGVDLFAPLQVVETHAEVLAAGNEVLAVVADVHRVDFLLLPHKSRAIRQTRHFFPTPSR